jgi:hypothetical protein
MAIKSIELEDQGLRYRLYFLKQAYDKMRLYVELCPDEIGWLGYVEKLKDGSGYMVTDVFLLDQEVHGATTELSPTAIMDYYNNLDEAGREEFLTKCKLWGHSHVNMAPTPSGQDDLQGKELSQDVDDYYIRLITNKKGEYNITFYDKVIKAKVMTDEVILYSPEGIELRKQIQEEIKEKVKKKTYTTSTPSTNYGTGYGSSYNSRDDYWKKNSATSSTKTSAKKKMEISKINIADIFKKSDYSLKFLEELSV